MLQAQAEHGLLERFRATPGSEFIAPQLHVLFAPQPFRLVGGEDQRPCAVGPFEAALRGQVSRAFLFRTNGEDAALALDHDVPDRKSTRLNSSHLGISYAVFCL